MTAGIQVMRDDGTVLQIDESFMNLQFIRRGSVSATQIPPGGGGTNWRTGSITVNSTTAIVAIRCAQPCYVTTTVVNGASTTYNYLVNNGGATVEYWVYDFGYAESGDRYGFQVFNPAGVLVFDSGHSYATCLGDFNGLMPEAAIWSTSEQMDAGRTLQFSGKQVAVAQMSTSPWVNFVTLISVDPEGNYDYYATTAVPSTWTPSVDSVSFRSSLWFNGVYGGGAPPSNRSSYGYLILDVTGT